MGDLMLQTDFRASPLGPRANEGHGKNLDNLILKRNFVHFFMNVLLTNIWKHVVWRQPPLVVHSFLDASSHLYMSVRPSVGRSDGRSVGWSVRPCVGGELRELIL